MLVYIFDLVPMYTSIELYLLHIVKGIILCSSFKKNKGKDQYYFFQNTAKN